MDVREKEREHVLLMGGEEEEFRGGEIVGLQTQILALESMGLA